MVYFFARRFFGETAAFYSGLITCTSVGTWLFTRVMVPEAIFALELTALFYLFLRGWQGTLDTRVAYWGASVVMALAALTLGLIGVLFPLGVVFFFILFTRSWGRWRELRIFSSTLIFLVIAVPWHWIAERTLARISVVLLHQRALQARPRHPLSRRTTKPCRCCCGGRCTWSGSFPGAFSSPTPCANFPGRRPGDRRWNHVQQARLLLFIWAGLILFFFSLTSGSRMEYYSFGAWPAIAVLLGIGLSDAEEARDRWLPRLQAGLAVIGLLASVCLGYLVISSLDISSKGGISHLLQYHDLDTYRLSMAHIFDLTPQTFAALRGPAVFAILIFIIGFGRAWLLRRRWKNSAATLTLAFAMALFFFAANWAFKRFEPRMSSRALADAILPYLRPQDQIVQYGDFNSGSSIPFYTHRHVWIYNGRFGTNLEIGSNYPDVPPTFLDDKQFPAFWSGPERVFIFVPEEFRKDALSRLPPDSSYLLAESAGKYIFRKPAAASGPAAARVGAEAASGGVSRLSARGKLFPDRQRTATNSSWKKLCARPSARLKREKFRWRGRRLRRQDRRTRRQPQPRRFRSHRPRRDRRPARSRCRPRQPSPGRLRTVCYN